MFVMPAFYSSLLCMFAAHDAVEARQVSGTEMQEHREVGGLITKSEARRCVVKLVAAALPTHQVSTETNYQVLKTLDPRTRH